VVEGGGVVCYSKWWWPRASRSQTRVGGEGVGVPAPVCTRPPARRSCFFTPTRLRAFVWPTQPARSHSLTLAPLVCAHRLSLARIPSLMLALVVLGVAPAAAAATAARGPSHGIYIKYIVSINTIVVLLTVHLCIYPFSIPQVPPSQSLAPFLRFRWKQLLEAQFSRKLK